MTIMLDRLAVSTVGPRPTVPHDLRQPEGRSSTATCPSGVPWCTADLDWHDEDESEHDSAFVILPTGNQNCTRHDEHGHRRATDMWLCLEREDVNGTVGEPTVYLAPNNAADQYSHTEEAHLGLNEAEELAYELLRLVAVARGSKRARDLKLGDAIVIDGTTQTVTGVLHDAGCCANREDGTHQCDGSVSVETNLSGDGEWAATHDLDDLVDVEPMAVTA